MSGTTSTSSAAATGAFTTSNGQVIGPNGTPFIARGIDVLEGQEPSAGTLVTDFPGINFVRLAIYDYASPAALSAYVTSLTAQGIVVELEDHNNNSGNAGGGSGQIFTGSALTTELNWYSSVASAFAGNPNVWFGTNNEPSEIDSSGNTDPAALSTWQQQTYQAIRDTGNTAPIMLEMNSAGVGQTGVGYTASVYAGMTNTIWDVHYYGWLSGYSTDQGTVSSTLSSIVSEARQLTGANGTMPVLIGEYGNSTTGAAIDANGDQVLTAVQQSGLGSVAWAWGSGGPGDGLSDGGTGLSSYGQEVAAYIASFGTTQTPPPSNPGATPSANDTVVTGTAAAITDTAGNTWTITAGGQVAVNGAADTTTSNVVELAYVNGAIWQENTGNLWWSKSAPADAWAGGAGIATSPLPAFTASANDTVVTNTTAAITDASDTLWTITAGGQVAVNGTADTTTSNVIELAYVNGSVWQENSSHQWWSKAVPADAWTGGIATSPLPVPPSANDTAVTNTTAAITDASGNLWTITAGGQVAVNGTADTTTSNVIELAYVNGSVWQENSGKLWWSKAGPADAWTGGGATSPLPVPPSANDTVVTNTTAAITDASSNTWTITAGGQVAVNGVADTTTANVIELAYVNGSVWQENAGKLWWDKATPSAAWAGGNGIATSPLPVVTPGIRVTAAGTTTSVSGATPATTKVDGDIFVLTKAGVVTATLGTAATTIAFVHMTAITLTEGAAAATVTADAGTNSFTAGKGALTVTAGSGADAYLYHAGNGLLAIAGFSVTKGDTLTIDKSLQASMTEKSDGHGGSMLTFAQGGGVDIKAIAAFPAADIHWK